MLPNLKDKTQTELQTLQTELACAYFADDVTDSQQAEIATLHKAVSTCLPHSFVLADLFNVESMTLDIPLEVYEADPAIGFITCPDCEGEGWKEVEGSAWYNRAWAMHTFTSMKPCATCHCEGLVLAAPEPIDVPNENLIETYNVWLVAA